jgi:hypothetical protein
METDPDSRQAISNCKLIKSISSVETNYWHRIKMKNVLQRYCFQ